MKEYCVFGHPLTEDNIYRVKGGVACRKCAIERAARHNQQHLLTCPECERRFSDDEDYQLHRVVYAMDVASPHDTHFRCLTDNELKALSFGMYGKGGRASRVWRRRRCPWILENGEACGEIALPKSSRVHWLGCKKHEPQMRRDYRNWYYHMRKERDPQWYEALRIESRERMRKKRGR